MFFLAWFDRRSMEHADLQLVINFICISNTTNGNDANSF